jgi:hypothetical protein
LALDKQPQHSSSYLKIKESDMTRNSSEYTAVTISGNKQQPMLDSSRASELLREAIARTDGASASRTSENTTGTKSTIGGGDPFGQSVPGVDRRVFLGLQDEKTSPQLITATGLAELNDHLEKVTPEDEVLLQKVLPELVEVTELASQPESAGAAFVFDRCTKILKDVARKSLKLARVIVLAMTLSGIVLPSATFAQEKPAASAPAGPDDNEVQNEEEAEAAVVTVTLIKAIRAAELGDASPVPKKNLLFSKTQLEIAATSYENGEVAFTLRNPATSKVYVFSLPPDLLSSTFAFEPEQVREVNTSEPTEAAPSIIGTVQNNGSEPVNVRNAPNTQGTIILRKLNPGEILDAIGKSPDGEWWEVLLYNEVNGQQVQAGTGFVNASVATFESAPETQQGTGGSTLDQKAIEVVANVTGANPNGIQIQFSALDPLLPEAAYLADGKLAGFFIADSEGKIEFISVVIGNKSESKSEYFFGDPSEKRVDIGLESFIPGDIIRAGESYNYWKEGKSSSEHPDLMDFYKVLVVSTGKQPETIILPDLDENNVPTGMEVILTLLSVAVPSTDSTKPWQEAKVIIWLDKMGPNGMEPVYNFFGWEDDISNGNLITGQVEPPNKVFTQGVPEGSPQMDAYKKKRQEVLDLLTLEKGTPFGIVVNFNAQPPDIQQYSNMPGLVNRIKIMTTIMDLTESGGNGLFVYPGYNVIRSEGESKVLDLRVTENDTDLPLVLGFTSDAAFKK